MIFPSQLDMIALFNEILTLDFKQESDYIFMAASQSENTLLKHPRIAAAAKEVSQILKLPIAYVMVNRVPPGAKIPWHRDWLKPTPMQREHPRIHRCHLSVQTNPDAFLYVLHDDRPEKIHLERGEWLSPFPYWKLHRVTNSGVLTRTHLIVDLDCPEPLGEYD